MLKMYAWAKSHMNREEGQTALEYSLVLAAVSIVLIALLVGIGSGIVTDAVTAVNAFAF